MLFLSKFPIYLLFLTSLDLPQFSLRGAFLREGAADCIALVLKALRVSADGNISDSVRDNDGRGDIGGDSSTSRGEGSSSDGTSGVSNNGYTSSVIHTDARNSNITVVTTKNRSGIMTKGEQTTSQLDFMILKGILY